MKKNMRQTDAPTGFVGLLRSHLRTPLRTLMATVVLGCMALPLHAEEFVEGVHYMRLPVPVETQDASKVEVVEIFSYACIHCRNFEIIYGNLCLRHDKDQSILWNKMA